MLPALDFAPVLAAAGLAGLPFLWWAARLLWRWLKWWWREPLHRDSFWNERPAEPGWEETLG